MKKLSILLLMLSFICCAGAFARVQYDSSGRYIVNDNTIRAQKRAQGTSAGVKALPAAKINYNDATGNGRTSNLKNNFPERKK